MRKSVLRQDLAFCLWDGVFYMAMTALAHEFFQKFGELLGLGRGRLGLVLTVPTFLAAVGQQVSPWAVKRFGSYRKWVAWTAGFQAAALLPLAALAWWAAASGADGAGGVKATLGEYGLEAALFVLAGAYWFGALAGNAAWMTVVGMLIPKRIEARYFTRRQAILNLTLLLTLAAATECLGRAGDAAAQLRVLGWMFLAAGACRAVSTWCLWKYSEPGLPEAPALVWPRELARRTRSHPGGRALLFLLCAQAAISIAYPFFLPYLLRETDITSRQFGWLVITGVAGRMVAPEALRWMIRRSGIRRAILMTMIWQITVPIVWIAVAMMEPFPNERVQLAWLAIAQLSAGFGFGAFEMCSMLLQLDHVPVRERTSVLSQFNLAFYSAGLFGSVVGSVIIAKQDGRLGFMIAFSCSVAARVISIGLLKHRGKPQKTVDSPAHNPRK